MDINRKIEVLSEVGELLSRLGITEDFSELERAGFDAASFSKSLGLSMDENAWFRKEDIFRSLYILGVSLNEEDLHRWAEMYSLGSQKDPKKVAVVMAGNIPAVGFHDFITVLMAGHHILAKLSSDDKYLIPAIADLMIQGEPGFADMISFTDETIKGFDAVIATGSNNTSRYFKQYFGNYPHIIRKNRNGLAVLTGDEDDETIESLGDDIFMYFGLGCRNVSKIFIPEDYKIEKLFEPLERFKNIADHHKYANNYDYNKSIFLVNGDDHYDNGFLLLKEETNLASPVAVVHYERYSELDNVNDFIDMEAENIQCIISDAPEVKNAIPPGTSQYPKLWDYADGVDTMKFLLSC